MASSLISLFLVACFLQAQSAQDLFHLVVQVPNVENTVEILTHLNQSLEMITQCDSTGLQVRLTASECELCDGGQLQTRFLLLETFFKKLFDSNYSLQAQKMSILDMGCCPLESRVMLSLFSHMDIDIPVFSGLLVSEPISNVFYLSSSSSVLMNALVHLLRALNWSRIAVIADDHSDRYFMESALFLLKEARVWDIQIVSYMTNPNVKMVVRNLQLYSVKIAFLSVDSLKAAQILCEAHSSGLVWPEYAWIVHSIQSRELAGTSCGVHSLAGVIFVNQNFGTNTGYQSGSGNVSCIEQGLFSDSLEMALLFDAITAITRAAVTTNVSSSILDNVFHLDFEGVTGRIQFTSSRQLERDVIITQQESNGTEIVIASLRNNKFEIAGNFLHSTKPDARLSVVALERMPVWYTSVEITVSTIFVTVSLILYVRYRKHPEIKATSVSMTLLIFVGCYLLLFFLFILILIELLRLSVFCTLVIWFSGIGLPTPLIFATLLVKMLRIYHIFNMSEKLKSRFSSDFALVIFVALILSPNVFILILFSSLSSYTWKFVSSVSIQSVHTYQGCMGDISVFLVLLLVYLLALMCVVTVVAFKTRKIRLREFRDTKKVNLLIFLMILTVTATLFYWIVLGISDIRFAYGWQGDSILHAGHILSVVWCQFCLILPKTFPVVMKDIKSKLQRKDVPL